MKRLFLFFLPVLLLAGNAVTAAGAGAAADSVFRLTLTGADCPFADFAEYGVWVPGGRKPLRGVLVLQHGCTMEQFGITKPYDLQYRAFARKWRLAILETALHGNCRIWGDPSSGSAAALMRVLAEVGTATDRPELSTVPWLLWGHSGGGYWTLAMLREYPERILAAVCYSAAWDPQWEYPAQTARIPVLLRHAGPKDAPFARCLETALQAFGQLRALDAPASIVYNHGENHNLSHLREAMVPFFESAMRARLPRRPGGPMRDVRPADTWLGDTSTLEIFPERRFAGDKAALCRFPDEAAARVWKEYAVTNEVADKTPPAAPHALEAVFRGDSLLVRWKAEADPESGIDHFNLYLGDAAPVRFPSEGPYQTYDRNGDNTRPPFPPAMEMCVPLPAGAGGKRLRVGVETVNASGLVSARRGVVVRKGR